MPINWLTAGDAIASSIWPAEVARDRMYARDDALRAKSNRDKSNDMTPAEWGRWCDLDRAAAAELERAVAAQVAAVTSAVTKQNTISLATSSRGTRNPQLVVMVAKKPGLDSIPQEPPPPPSPFGSSHSFYYPPLRSGLRDSPFYRTDVDVLVGEIYGWLLGKTFCLTIPICSDANGNGVPLKPGKIPLIMGAIQRRGLGRVTDAKCVYWGAVAYGCPYVAPGGGVVSPPTVSLDRFLMNCMTKRGCSATATPAIVQPIIDAVVDAYTSTNDRVDKAVAEVRRVKGGKSALS